MSRIRRDPVADRWVIVAPERADRPMLYGREETAEACPFCPGNEGLTPPEILAWGRTAGGRDTSGWRGRVVPNRYPALGPEPPGTGGSLLPEGALFLERPGAGGHEVVVETPEHVWRPEAPDAEALAETLAVCAERMRHWSAHPGVRYVLVFKNHGEAAGATIPHPHFQLLALPLVPRTVHEEVEAAERHRRREGDCLWCRLLTAEREAGARWILETETVAAIAPYASRVPYEVWLLPRRHEIRFETSAGLREMATALADVLAALAGVLGDPAWNLVVHTAPVELAAEGSYHWHLEVLPRTVRFAGFEWGSGLAMNPVAPETAALALRGELTR